jgi:hypothetical protein
MRVLPVESEFSVPFVKSSDMKPARARKIPFGPEPSIFSVAVEKLKN